MSSETGKDFPVSLFKMEEYMEQTLVMQEICRQRFQPAVDKVKELLESESECIAIVIDGMSASGKSTLGYYLKELFDCNLFHTDDFFLQDEQNIKCNIFFT